MIDSNKQMHREKFKEFVKELLNTMLIEDILLELRRVGVMKEALEQID